MSIEKDLHSIININESEIIEIVANNCAPEDVFKQDVLEAWAESNGYVKDGDA